VLGARVVVLKSPPVAGLEACAKENEGVDPAGASESEVLPKEAPVEGNKLGEADGALENPPKDAVEADAVPSPAGVEVGAEDPNRPPLEGVPNVNPLAAGEGVAPNVFVEDAAGAPKGFATPAAEDVPKDGSALVAPKAGLEAAPPKVAADVPAPKPEEDAGAPPNIPPLPPNAGDEAAAPNAGLDVGAPNALPPPRELPP